MMLRGARQLWGIKGKANTEWLKESNVRHSQLLPTVRPLVAVVVALDVLWFFLVLLLVFWSFPGKSKRTAAEMVYCLSPPLTRSFGNAFCLSCQATERWRKRVKVLKPFWPILAASECWFSYCCILDPATARLLWH